MSSSPSAAFLHEPPATVRSRSKSNHHGGAAGSESRAGGEEASGGRGWGRCGWGGRAEGAEDLAEGARAHRVHGVGLEVHEDGARDEAIAAGLVVVDERTLELEVGVAGVLSGVVDVVLVAYQASRRWDSLGMGARERTAVAMSSQAAKGADARNRGGGGAVRGEEEEVA
jgi:hypothetical protein